LSKGGTQNGKKTLRRTWFSWAFPWKGHLIWGGILADFSRSRKAIICGKFRPMFRPQGDQRRNQDPGIVGGFSCRAFCGSEAGRAKPRVLSAFPGRSHHGVMEWMESRRAERVDPSPCGPEQKVSHAGADYGPGHDPQQFWRGRIAARLVYARATTITTCQRKS